MAGARNTSRHKRSALVPIREPGGKLQRGASEERRLKEKVLAIACSQPHRRKRPLRWTDDAGKVHDIAPDDPRLGYALGRACLEGKVSEAQLLVGNRAGSYLEAYAGLKTPSGLGYGTQDLERSTGGGGTGREIPAWRVEEITADYQGITRALAQTREPDECLEALVMVCQLGVDPTHPEVFGYLRIALNALGRAWG